MNTFTIKGEPVGKPRQTRSDKWRVRPRVARYRLWADMARLSAPRNLSTCPLKVHAVAYFSIPKSLSQRKREEMKGQPHRVKPDADNTIKSLLDSLFPNDAVIHDLHITKLWDDGDGARMVVTVD